MTEPTLTVPTLNLNAFDGMNIAPQEEAVLLPEGEFRGSTFIGPAFAGPMYMVSTDQNINDLNSMNAPEDQIKADHISLMGAGEWKQLYWKVGRKADADHAAKLLDRWSTFLWVVTMPTAKCLSLTDEQKSKFGPDLTSSARITGLGSKKYRHEFLLISQPATVAAAARFMGLKTAEFNLSELNQIGIELTDEQSQALIGNPDDKDGFTNNRLFTQREALWKLLGEPDGRKFQTIGLSAKHSTTSAALSACMEKLTADWKAPLFCKVAWVPNPSMNAVHTSNSSGKDWRETVPAIVEFYPNEAAAKAAADEELAERGETTTTAPTTSNMPAMPAGWESVDPDVWISSLNDLNAQPPAQAAAALGATVPDVIAWRTHLNG